MIRVLQCLKNQLNLWLYGVLHGCTYNMCGTVVAWFYLSHGVSQLLHGCTYRMVCYSCCMVVLIT